MSDPISLVDGWIRGHVAPGCAAEGTDAADVTKVALIGTKNGTVDALELLTETALVISAKQA